VDRVDLAQYVLTGEIRGFPSALEVVLKSNVTTVTNAAGAESNTKKKKRNRENQAAHLVDTPLVGSVAMWNVPAGAPLLEVGIAFNTVDFMTIVND